MRKFLKKLYKIFIYDEEILKDVSINEKISNYAADYDERWC